MDQHTQLLNAYLTAQKDLEEEYRESDGYWIDYSISGKTHTVKVYKRGLSGEGTTKNDTEGAFKAVYERSKVKNEKVPLVDGGYRLAVQNYVAKDEGMVKEIVNDQGKATVTVLDLLVKKSSSDKPKGVVYYRALCALRESTK